MQRHQLIEKSVSALLTAALFLLATTDQFNTTFIVLGQGHFAATYYFQWKAGKVNTAYLLRYLVAFVAVFGLYAMYPNPLLLAQITIAWFGFHAISDEFFLLQRPPSFAQSLMALPFILIYAWLIVMPPFIHQFDHQFLAVLLGILVLAHGIKLIAREKLGASDFYFTFGSLLMMVVIGKQVSPFTYPVLGLLVIFHYSNWYINTFQRYRRDEKKLTSYLRAVLTINILILGLYAVYRNWAPAVVPLGYVFRRDAFFEWTILHMFVTFRLGDVKRFRPRLKSAA